MANYFGQESLGTWKVRGNGVLLLTKSQLYFEMWKPKKQISISVNKISHIENSKSHLHRTVFRPLLKVIFTNENTWKTK